MSARILLFPTKKRSAATEALRSIRRLKAAGIDAILPLGALIERCRNSSYTIEADTKGILKKFGLLESDGSVNETVRDVVLSETKNGNFFEYRI